MATKTELQAGLKLMEETLEMLYSPVAWAEKELKLARTEWETDPRICEMQATKAQTIRSLKRLEVLEDLSRSNHE